MTEAEKQRIEAEMLKDYYDYLDECDKDEYADIFVDDDYEERMARKAEGYDDMPDLLEMFDIAVRASQLSDSERAQYDKPFENKRLEGKDAHAYKDEYSNAEIAMLYERGLSYRQIAKVLKCSPNTIRNRLIKMELINKE